jgi:hypothetical protein
MTAAESDVKINAFKSSVEGYSGTGDVGEGDSVDVAVVVREEVVGDGVG